MRLWGTGAVGLMLLLGMEMAVFADLSANFDASSSVPSDWINGGTENDSVSSHLLSPPYCRAMGAGDTLQTPMVDYPTNLSFYVDASNGGDGNTGTVDFNIDGGAWVEFGSFVVNKNGGMQQYALNSSPDLSASQQIRFRFNASFSTWYLDDVDIQTSGVVPSNSPPVLTFSPMETNWMVEVGETVQIDLSATEPDGDEITLLGVNLPGDATFSPNPLTGPSPLTNTFTWIPAATGSYAMVFSAADKDGTNELTVRASAYIPDLCLLLTEHFDAATALPSGWVNGGTVADTDPGHLASAPYARALRLGNYLVTQPVDFPTNVSFYVDASNAGAGQRASVSYQIGLGGWIDLASFAVGTGGSIESISLLGLPMVSESEEVQFRFSSAFNTWYLDDVVIWGRNRVDQPPVLHPIGDQVAAVDSVLTVAVSAMDYEGDGITLYASNLPPGATFNAVTNAGAVTNLLTYAPGEFESGLVYTSTFYAVDIDGVSEETITISVFDQLISFATASTAVWEEARTQQVAVVLSSPGEVTVEIVAAGTAVPGEDGDYLLPETNLVFTAEGSRTQFLDVVIFDDDVIEVPLTLVLSLTNAAGAGLSSPGRHQVDFQDNDAAYFNPLTENPGWSLEGQWAFGRPLGLGYTDPTSGYTGTNVYGYNLYGDYQNNMSQSYYLTTPAIDCSRFRNIQLQFARWLIVAPNDNARIQISYDQVNWVDVWSNGSLWSVDWDWSVYTYDISSYADGAPSVYIRWGLGPTDGSGYYCGWNIDDVLLTGEAVSNALFQFSAVGYAADETSSVVQVTVERSGLTNGISEILFFTSNQTATAGSDYIGTEDTLVFAPGERTQAISIPLLDDTDVEGDEMIGLHLLPTDSGDILQPSEAVLVLRDNEATGEDLPFFDGFESGLLSSNWSAASTGAGRIEVGTGFDAAFEGALQLGMDATQYNVYGLNEAVLMINLAGQTNVILDFMENNYDYRMTALPEHFMGSVDGDGVSVSADGLNWHRLFPAPPAYVSRSGYVSRTTNLTDFAASKGLASTSQFRIKFQQVDGYPLPTYGRYFDNIQVYDPTQVADVQLALSASEDPVEVGTELSYTLMVTNAGPLAATGVLVSNQLPAGAEFVSVTSSQGTCTRTGEVIHCMVGELTPGGAVSIDLAVTAPPSPCSLTNRVGVSGENFDPLTSNNRAETVTVVDERGGTIEWMGTEIEINEREGTTSLSVIRSVRTYGEVSVAYATLDGTALAGADYMTATGRLVFASGQTVAVIPLTLYDDDLDESGEIFSVSLSGADGDATLGSNTVTTLLIQDDDGRASFPFLETFDSGPLTNCWWTYSSDYGRIQVTSNHNPYAGTEHLTMDSSVSSTFSLNELNLTINLSGQQGVTLVFWHKHFGDEGQTMSSTFAGHENTDGVAMSMDGTNWVKVQGLTPAEGTDSEYSRFEIPLDEIATLNGLTYTSDFKFKFQQYDNYPISTDGFAFDEIALFSQPGELRYSQAAYDVSETGGVAVVTVERVNGTLGEVTVPFATTDDSALAGADYVSTNGVLIFADGETTASFSVDLIDDEDDEGAETILLTLGEPTGGATLSTPSQAVLTVHNDDGAGTFVFKADTFATSESNEMAWIYVWRLEGAEGETTVSYGTIDGTALAGLDYIESTGTVFFADGMTSRYFTIALLDDAEQEDMESIGLYLTNASPGAAIGMPSTAALNILDDEDPNYDYYLPAYGKEGAELKQALHDIIDDHQAYNYTPSLWNLLQEVDECPTNASQVQLAYMQTGRDKYNNGAASGQWNREHVWPQSHGVGNPYGTGDPDPFWPSSVDAHNLKPSDVDINNLRGNKDFDRGGASVAGAPASCKTTSSTFEPPDVSKGDIARMMFYMAVRYAGDEENEPDLELVDSADTTGTQMGKISTLMQWHFLDPPDEVEANRNQLIHANWQGNRNPFIDHPEWALELWEYIRTLATLAGEGGSISPENPEVVYPSDQAFDIQPDPYWTIADIRTNGVSLGVDYGTSSYSFVWSSVAMTGAVEAVFAADLASQGTPLWWLVEQGYTNDFAAAELGDPDADGCLTWKEYLAGSIPTNAASLLQFEVVDSASVENGLILRWQSASNRTYTIWKGSNLLADFTNQLATNVPAHPPMNVYTDTVDGVRLQFYRIDVEP
jgi:uncharacterized repeat protein (TIGR01451 family)